MSDDNPCRFKVACRKCLKVQIAERPNMCAALKCPDFKPCPDCGKNKSLYPETGKCYPCSGISKADASNLQYHDIINRKNAVVSGTAPVAGRQINNRITPPGTPPPGLSEDHVAYYKSRWEDYKGYYRDPSAYFVCHLIILEEINISSLTESLLGTQNERRDTIARALHTSITTMKTLKDQLPDREAEEEMDENKTIAAMYEEYVKNKKSRTINGVSRILSPEAIALAPELTFKIDPRQLLERCGFKEMDIEEAMSLLEKTPEDIQDSPVRVLEFFGFRLKDEYAMEFDSPLIENINPEEELDV